MKIVDDDSLQRPTANHPNDPMVPPKTYVPKRTPRRLWPNPMANKLHTIAPIVQHPNVRAIPPNNLPRTTSTTKYAAKKTLSKGIP